MTAFGLTSFAARALTHRLAPFVAAIVVAGTAATAWAYWTTNAAAGSHGSAVASTVNQGPTPTANLAALGREVSVSWGTSTLANGAPVTGYLVKRYPAGGGVGTISPIGTCAGTVAATSCLEDDVPAGTWKYTVTPVVGTWRGAESLLSGIVTVAGPALTVNGSPFGNSAFTPALATAAGSITGFSVTGGGGGHSPRPRRRS